MTHAHHFGRIRRCVNRVAPYQEGPAVDCFISCKGSSLRRGRLTEPIFFPASIAVFPRRRSWTCSGWGERRSGVPGPRICRAAWNMPCIDEARPGKPRQYDTDVEAQIAALACSAPPTGASAGPWSYSNGRRSHRRGSARQPGNRSPDAQKNDLKPWRKLMWCIGALTKQYRHRMYDLLELYARPFQGLEPVICVDEKSKQQLRDTRDQLPMTNPERRRRTTTSMSAKGPAICSWPSSPRADTGPSRSPRAGPKSTSLPSSSTCSNTSTRRRVAFTWFSTISTPTFASVSRPCSATRAAERLLAPCANFTTHRNTPAGSTWRKSKSASSIASALTGACPTVTVARRRSRRVGTAP